MINSRNNVLRASFLMFMCFALTFAIPAFAGGEDGKVDKTTQKARAKLEKNGNPDWKAYCKSAQMCVRKNTNMEEAHSWLEKSIEMKATPENLEAMGDFYLANNDKRKAMDYYLKSLKAGVLENGSVQDGKLQRKVAELQEDLS